MEHKTTRKELINNILNHTGNYGYNNETDKHDDILFTRSELNALSNDDLVNEFREMTSWGDEIEIIVL